MKIFIAASMLITSSAFAISPVGTATPTATPKATADDVARKTKDAVGTTVDYAKESKDEFEVRMQKNLKATQKAIRDLKTKAAKSSAATKKQMDAQATDLEKKQDQLKAKLAAVGTSSSTAWHDLAGGVTRAWQDVKASANKAADEFHTSDKVSDQ